MSRPPNANGRSLGARKQTQSSPQSDTSCALAQAQSEHRARFADGSPVRKEARTSGGPFASLNINTLARMLNDAPQGSAQRREIQRELRLRLNETIHEIEREFDLPSESKRRRRLKRHFLRRPSAAQHQSNRRKL
jgi:hypothetical protein